MTTTKLAAAALLSLSLSACSDDTDSPDKTTSSSGSSSVNESSSAATTDRSAQVFNGYEQPKVLATTSGSVDLGRSEDDEVTFEVTGLTITSDATILRYQLSVEEESVEFGMEGRFWYDQPVLRVPGSDTKVQSVTGSLPSGDENDAEEICVCTAVSSAGEDPRPQTVLYQPLPKDAKKVEVILPGLDPMTVPVTR